MMTPYERRKLLIEMLHKKPGVYVPELMEALDVWDRDVRDELRDLHHSTERMRKEVTALRTRNEELEAFAHTVAHNLKNPLSVIILTSAAITDITNLNPAELKDFMEQIRSTAGEMNGIIDNLLMLSEVNTVETPREAVDMANVVEKVRNRLEPMLKEFHGRLMIPKTWPSSLGYGPWIEEVWANYLSNALKYGGHPPYVQLGASTQPDGMVRYWVRDNGQGIPLKTQVRLFTPFTQLGQVHNLGHGLGLSIVRRIVEKLGGQVGVESEAGRGSVFYFTLPSDSITAKSMPDGYPRLEQVRRAGPEIHARRGKAYPRMGATKVPAGSA